MAPRGGKEACPAPSRCDRDCNRQIQAEMYESGWWQPHQPENVTQETEPRFPRFPFEFVRYDLLGGLKPANQLEGWHFCQTETRIELHQSEPSVAHGYHHEAF